MTSPTQRSLAHLKAKGYTAAVTEHWNPFAHIRQDLFGFIDIVAVKMRGKGVLAVQTTSADNISKRIAKSMVIPALTVWLSSGNTYIVQGWSLKGKKGERKMWQVTERKIILNKGELVVEENFTY